MPDEAISDGSKGDYKDNRSAGEANLLVQFQSSLLHALRGDAVSGGPKGFE
jgi:hypothetical protein